MSLSHDEIIAIASKRKNKRSGGLGVLLRSDIVEMLESVIIEHPEDKEKAITDFVGKCQFLSESTRERILKDWQSY